MKNPALFSAFALLLSGANAQFVQKPLNFPADSYFTRYHGIVDSNTVWVGATLDTIGGSYSKAIKTTDGGNTWQFYSIPASDTYITGPLKFPYYHGTPNRNADRKKISR